MEEFLVDYLALNHLLDQLVVVVFLAQMLLHLGLYFFKPFRTIILFLLFDPGKKDFDQIFDHIFPVLFLHFPIRFKFVDLILREDPNFISVFDHHNIEFVFLIIFFIEIVFVFNPDQLPRKPDFSYLAQNTPFLLAKEVFDFDLLVVPVLGILDLRSVNIINFKGRIIKYLLFLVG